ncbi:hypothetical protein QJS10_CPA03g00459 [Acorus calamus]|uniref:Glycosyltransferase 61 catalytic domain-containing protein n=1 Tax=Acorus calamus TaxID=4465 RepID=A0AAV9F8Y6_ACOCL|nr:hypothetical protein QJS10_CPA03g00459 [Acorus calamus]
MGFVRLESNLARSFSRTEARKISCAAVLTCLLFSLVFVAVIQPYMDPFPILGLRVTVGGPSTMLVVEDESGSGELESEVLGVAAGGSQLVSSPPKNKISCNDDPRSDLCEMIGDVRIQGNKSSVILITDTDTDNQKWTIRPYPRKGDESAMGNVRRVTLKYSARDTGTLPRCDVNHSVPVVIFSDRGYTGNLFHDFTDVLVPLFLTSREFNGEVQFMVTHMRQWWINKYERILSKLSNYEILDFDADARAHCFPRALVGLRCHKELSIDPARAPNGYDMSDFRAFLRDAYALNRSRPLARAEGGARPRLLIVARNRTRSFVNIGDVTRAAREAGFEPVSMEAAVSTGLGEVARVVNSCDAMLGVHGAGLTNFLFLPTNATLVQVVPWGGLEGICRLDFGRPALDAKIKYMEYIIKKEESTLIDNYPSDHELFRDPHAYHKSGWGGLRIFLDQQNVKVDVGRFGGFLKEVYENLGW